MDGCHEKRYMNEMFGLFVFSNLRFRKYHIYDLKNAFYDTFGNKIYIKIKS